MFPLEGQYGMERLQASGFNFKSCVGGYQVGALLVQACRLHTRRCCDSHTRGGLWWRQQEIDSTPSSFEHGMAHEDAAGWLIACCNMLSLACCSPLSLLCTLQYKPRRGDALMFYSMHPMGHLTSTHCMAGAQWSRGRSGWRQSGCETSASRHPACETVSRRVMTSSCSLCRDTFISPVHQWPDPVGSC